MMDLKFVFTVSLVAVMAVTAANADIASTTYYTGDADAETLDPAKTNAINVTLDTVAQKAVITAKQATSSQKGVMLLYDDGTGSSTAGTMTQKAITDALDEKADSSTTVTRPEDSGVGGETRPVFVGSNGQATVVKGTSVPVGVEKATDDSTTWASIWIEE